MKKNMDFWVIVGLLVVLMGFLLSMNARMDNMATKADLAQVKADLKVDIARVETDIKEIRYLLIDHIKDGHNHRKQKREPASDPGESKSK